MLWRVFAIRSARRPAHVSAISFACPSVDLPCALRLRPDTLLNTSQVPSSLGQPPGDGIAPDNCTPANQLEISCILFVRLPSYVTNAQKPSIGQKGHYE